MSLSVETTEAHVMGALLLDADAMDKVSAILSPGHFRNRAIRRVYAAMHRLYTHGDPHDAQAVTAYLRMDADHEAVEELLGAATSSANIEYYASQIRQEYARDEGVKLLTKAADDVRQSDDPKRELDTVASRLFDVDSGSHGHSYSSGDAAVRVWQTAEDLAGKRARGEKVEVGHPSPWPQLNRLIGGFRPGKVYVLGADTGVGKSVAALQCALGVAKRGGKTAYFSGEMDADEFAVRVLSMLTGINPMSIIEGDLTAEQMVSITTATPKARTLLDNVGVVYDDLTPDLMLSYGRRMRRQTGLDLVVLDYLQLARADGFRASDQRQMFEYISKTMKRLAVEMSVPLLCLSQFKRNDDRKRTGMPALGDLHGSSAFAKDADVVMLLAREQHPDYGNPDILGEKSHLAVVKGRSSRMGVADLTFDENHMVFRDHSTRF